MKITLLNDVDCAISGKSYIDYCHHEDCVMYVYDYNNRKVRFKKTRGFDLIHTQWFNRCRTIKEIHWPCIIQGRIDTESMIVTCNVFKEKNISGLTITTYVKKCIKEIYKKYGYINHLYVFGSTYLIDKTQLMV